MKAIMQMSANVSAQTGPPNNAGTIRPTPPQLPRSNVSSCALPFHACRFGGNVAEASFPVAEIPNRVFQILRAKFGPEHRAEIQLGIRRLPNQEIAESILAGGSDDEVGIREMGGVEIAGDEGIIDLVRRDAVGDNPANRGEQLLPTSIIERKRENELVVLTRELDRILDGFAHLRWEAIETADMPQLGALTVQLAELAVERFPRMRTMPLTSSAGRLQFSVENAQRVR